MCRYLDSVATHNVLQIWTVVITAPFHIMGVYRRELEKRPWAWEIKEMTWNKVTMHWQPISNVPGLSVISNCEGMIVVFCKKADLPIETVQMLEGNFYAHSE